MFHVEWPIALFFLQGLVAKRYKARWFVEPIGIHTQKVGKGGGEWGLK